MISLKQFSGRRGALAPDRRNDSLPPHKPAKENWSVVVEPMTVNRETVYALSFHRKGTSVYYLHRHYRDREEADTEFVRLSNDLSLGLTDFELQYDLDSSA